MLDIRRDSLTEMLENARHRRRTRFAPARQDSRHDACFRSTTSPSSTSRTRSPGRSPPRCWATSARSIIKIEPPTGDIARAWGPPFYGSEPSYVVGLHRNKQSVVIDFKHAEGKELFFKLVERADVVLENYRVGVIDKLGLGYEAGRTRNPRIIYCSISGFGQTGPYRDRAALDLILQAESGMMSVTGEEGGRGVRAGVSIADMTAGMYAAYGIMTALHARARTGRGQHVDVSMLEGQLVAPADDGVRVPRRRPGAGADGHRVQGAAARTRRSARRRRIWPSPSAARSSGRTSVRSSARRR